MMSNTPFFITPDLSPQNKHLMHVLNFNEKVLDANQEGTLTPGQQKYLWKRFREQYHNLVSPVIIAIVLIGLDLVLDRSSGTYLSGAFGIGVFILGIFIVLDGQSKIHRDLRSGHVESAKGPVQISSVSPVFYGVLSIYPYKISVKDSPHSFRVTKQAAAAFKEKDVYTLYFAPTSQILLSAEHMPEESPRRMVIPSPPPQAERQAPSAPQGSRKKGRDRTSRQKHAQSIKGLHRGGAKKARAKATNNQRAQPRRDHHRHHR